MMVAVLVGTAVIQTGVMQRTEHQYRFVIDFIITHVQEATAAHLPSPSLSFSLSLPPSPSLSPSPSLVLSLPHSVFVSPPLSPLLCLCLSPSLPPSPSLFPSLFLSPSLSRPPLSPLLSLSLCPCLSVYICLPVCRPVCLSELPLTCVSARPPACVCPSLLNFCLAASLCPFLPYSLSLPPPPPYPSPSLLSCFPFFSLQLIFTSFITNITTYSGHKLNLAGPDNRSCDRPTV